MKILVNDTHKIIGKQTIVFDGTTQQHFLVSSVNNSIVNKTFILKCDSRGNVKDWNEVYTVVPEQHDFIVDALQSFYLTTKNFNMMM